MAAYNPGLQVGGPGLRGHSRAERGRAVLHAEASFLQWLSTGYHTALLLQQLPTKRVCQEYLGNYLVRQAGQGT